MSDVADFAIPLSARTPSGSAASRVFDATLPTQVINDAHSFPFATRRWLAGFRRVAGAIIVGGTGSFLLMQISSTPGLVIQLAILGMLLIACAIFLLAGAVHDLFGRFIVDGRGVHQRPAFAGFSIGWEELQKWEVREDLPEISALPVIRLWGPQASGSYVVQSGLLSEADRHEIRRLLQLRAPLREAARRVPQ